MSRALMIDGKQVATGRTAAIRTLLHVSERQLRQQLVFSLRMAHRSELALN
jgi:hypothetical protein